jgi:hypothetical protein
MQMKNPLIMLSCYAIVLAHPLYSYVGILTLQGSFYANNMISMHFTDVLH